MVRRDNQVQTARPLPAPSQEYDPITAEIMRRTIEQNFEDLYAQVAVIRGAPETEESLLAFEASLTMGHIVTQDDGTLTDLDPSLYAQKAADETISGTWDFTSAPTIDSSTIVTAANLEAQLEALTTSELDLSGVSALEVGGSLELRSTLPHLYLWETDAPTDEGRMEFRVSGGDFQVFALDDSGGLGSKLMRFIRSGTEWPIGELTAADMRIRTDVFATSPDVFWRIYTDEEVTIERRRESDFQKAWEIHSPSSGDLLIRNYNWGGLQDTWVSGDVSTGNLTLDGNLITLAGPVRTQSEVYQDGMVDAGAGGTVTIDWSNGSHVRRRVTATSTIDVDGSTMRQGNTYVLQLTNTSGASRSIVWSGVDHWQGGAASGTLSDDHSTTVRFTAVPNVSGTLHVIGEVILNNISWT